MDKYIEKAKEIYDYCFQTNNYEIIANQFQRIMRQLFPVEIPPQMIRKLFSALKSYATNEREKAIINCLEKVIFEGNLYIEDPQEGKIEIILGEAFSLSYEGLVAEAYIKAVNQLCKEEIDSVWKKGIYGPQLFDSINAGSLIKVESSNYLHIPKELKENSFIATDATGKEKELPYYEIEAVYSKEDYKEKHLILEASYQLISEIDSEIMRLKKRKQKYLEMTKPNVEKKQNISLADCIDLLESDIASLKTMLNTIADEYDIFSLIREIKCTYRPEGLPENLKIIKKVLQETLQEKIFDWRKK